MPLGRWRTDRADGGEEPLVQDGTWGDADADDDDEEEDGQDAWVLSSNWSGRVDSQRLASFFGFTGSI